MISKTWQRAVRTFIAAGVFVTAIALNISPSFAYAGTLENGNLAYAQSEFNKGSACDYLPGYETGYDAWHLVLTTRGATFQQDPSNPKVSINLNMVFMSQDGSKFVIKSGAWVQTGKGAYVYTLVRDKIRIVQAGSLATINGSDSGIRLSHTCPGSGEATLVPTISPTPTPSATPTVSPSASPTPTASPSITTSTATPTPTPTTKFSGVLENGNLALADSEFNKGSECDYLPGYETGYDAWHLVLTTRGATFIQDPRDPKVSINLNILFQRTDGSRYVITQGAWVQFGKGAYVYTPTSAQDRIVQAGTFAETNTTSSGMRLSHTCPGEKSATTEASPTPSPTPTIAPTPTPSPTQIPTIAPTPTPSPSESLSSCKLCIIRSYANPSPRPSESPGPGYREVEPSPSPTPVVSPSATPTPAPSATPTQTSAPTPRPTTPNSPIVPPVVENPETVVFVKPDEPKVIVLPELKDIPAQNIRVTEPPKYGTLTINPNSTLTYVSNIADSNSTLVDKFTITFTDLSGAVIVANREVVLAQDGDVPSIIQTGFGLKDLPNSITLLLVGVIIVLSGVVIMRRRKISSIKAITAISVVLLSLAFVVQPVGQPTVEAACKPVKPKGKTVGRIVVGNVDMPIKPFTYPSGGIMEPQATTLSAGVSLRHMPLSSQLGTSVITWHRDYNRCVNELNIFFDRKVGSQFEITDENGEVQSYRVTKRLQVKKGDYKKSWFTLVGPRQLTLVTCTGKFRNGHYEDNLVVIATKIS